MLGYSLVWCTEPYYDFAIYGITTSLYMEHPNITNNLVVSVMSDF